MEYKIIIKGNEYPLPKIIASFNQETFEKYKEQVNEVIYLETDKLLKENDFQSLKRISDQCCNCIGMYCVDDKEDMEEYSKLGPKMRFYDDMAKINYEKGNIPLACDKIMMQLELILDFYQKQLEKSEMKIQSNKTR